MAMQNPDYMVTIHPENRNPIKAYMPETFMFDVASNYEAPFAQGFMGDSPGAQMAKLAGLRLSTQVLTAQIWQGSNDTLLSLELEFQAETDPVMEVRNPILDLMRLTMPSLDPTTNMMLAPGPQMDKSMIGQMIKDAGAQVVNTAKAVYNIATSATVKQGQLQSSDSVVPDKNSNTAPAPGTQGNQGLGSSKNLMKYLRNKISIRIGNYAFFDCVVIVNVQKTYTSNFDLTTGLPMHARVAVQFKPFFQIMENDLNDIFVVSR